MEFAQDLFGLVETVLTSVAIVTAGLWAYFLFWRRRQSAPRASLTLDLTTALLPGSKRLVHVGLGVLNQGQVLLSLKYAEMRVRQVVPFPEDLVDGLERGVDPIPAGSTEMPWPMIVGREWKAPSCVLELEPGESDSLHADFVLEEDVEVVELYAFVCNPRKKGTSIGWTKTELHTFAFRGDDVGQKQKRPKT